MNKKINLILFKTLLLWLSSVAANATEISLNTATTYQTMHSWEMVDFSLYSDIPDFSIYGTIDNGDPFTGNLIPNALVTNTKVSMGIHTAELGINRIRLESNARYERNDFNPVFNQYMIGDINRAAYKTTRDHALNDNNDPFVIDWNGFSFAEFDSKINSTITPIKNAVEMQGESLYVLLTYVDFKDSTSISGFDHLAAATDVEEYAEYILAHFIHMNTKYGYVPNGVEIKLEPDVGYQVPAAKIADVIIATSTRLTSNGFTDVDIIAPSNTNLASASSFFDAMVAHNSDILNYISEISYHVYGGDSQANREALATRALDNNLRSSQMEMWHNSIHNLDFTFNHISEANNSVYAFAAIMSESTSGLPGLTAAGLSPILLNLSGNGPDIIKNWSYWFMRQFTKYIKRGSVRFESISDDAGVRSLSFANIDGTTTVVLKTDQAKTLNVSGLPAGEYGASYVTGGTGLYTEHPTSGTEGDHQVVLATQTITSGQVLTVNIPNSGVITIFGIPSAIGPGECDGQLGIDIQDVICTINMVLNPPASPTGQGECDGSVGINIQDVICVIDTVLNR